MFLGRYAHMNAPRFYTPSQGERELQARLNPVPPTAQSGPFVGSYAHMNTPRFYTPSDGERTLQSQIESTWKKL